MTATELVCVHRWGNFFEGFGKDEARRFKSCRGLCKGTWYEGEPEPEVVIARSK